MDMVEEQLDAGGKGNKRICRTEHLIIVIKKISGKKLR